MRRSAFGSLLALAASGCLASTARVPALMSSGSAVAAPDGFALVLPRYPGPGKVELGAMQGKVLLVDFWASWCLPCQEAAMAYERLYEQLHAQGLEVYGVSVDEDPRFIPDFVKRLGIAYPILLDPGAELSGPRLGLESIPTALIVDRAGRLRYRHEGFSGEVLAQEESEIRALLAGPAPAPLVQGAGALEK